MSGKKRVIVTAVVVGLPDLEQLNVQTVCLPGHSPQVPERLRFCELLAVLKAL